MPSVNSSAISFIDYDESSLTLTITFTDSGSYDYYNVPKSIYDSFLVSSSKGSFFNQYIKDKF